MGDQQLGFQEPENILQNPPGEFSIDPPDLSSLRLYSSPPSAGAAVKIQRRCHSLYSGRGCSSHSRKRPSISGPNRHHHAKKLFLDTPPLPETNHSPTPAAESLPLRRTVSASLAGSGSGTPSNASPARPNLPATPGLPATLRRCVSDPIPSPPTESKSLTGPSAEDFDDTPSSKDNCVNGSEESLSVEIVGERSNIHFKCPCGKAYEFLLIEGNCFFKLT